MGPGSESFDNIGNAMSTMLQVLTLSGWADVMTYTQDALSPASSLFFLGLVTVGPIQLTSYFVALMATKIMEFRSQTWYSRETANILRWQRANLRVILNHWHDNAALSILLQRRPLLQQLFNRTYLARLDGCFEEWKTETALRNMLRSARGQVFLRLALARLERRLKKAPWHRWKYTVLRLKRKIKSVLDKEAELGARSSILTFDALGRPKVARKDIEALKARFRKAAEEMERQEAEGTRVTDIGQYLAERVLKIRAALDMRTYLTHKLRQADEVRPSAQTRRPNPTL